MGKSQKRNPIKHFFEKRETHCYIQNQFYNHIDDEEYRSLFSEFKQTCEKE